MQRLWRAIVLSTLVFLSPAAPAAADPNRVGLDLSISPSAETGKPAIGMPYAAPAGSNADTACRAAVPCEFRLFGTVRKNGAVELQAPAWRW